LNDLDQILEESIIALELPAVLEELAAHAFSIPGKDHILASRPETDLDVIIGRLRFVAQLREAVSLNGNLGFSGLVPFERLFDKLANRSTILDAEELLITSDLLSLSESAKNKLLGLSERYDLLIEQGEKLISLGHLTGHLTRLFDEHGGIRSNASPALMRIRERGRTTRENIHRKLEQVVQDRDLSRVVQEDYVTLRNDRYVILLRPEFKGALDGIIHDHSRSGASVYVEPLHVVELNNQIASLSDEEAEEIRRIMAEATQMIRSSLDEIRHNYEILAGLDAFQARALYAAETDSVSPELGFHGFSLKGARHPLLVAGEPVVVPMDIVQDEITKVTVISGANMGGKTVALKIAGLFPLMVRCGMHVPAKEGTVVQPFPRIMADIGDDQDIRGRQSSFSGHMARIRGILEHAADGDLVLLDELGGATDPDEGSALSMAITDGLMDQGARVVITTHLTHLKSYALAKPGVKNVSVEFHPETLKPTFRLLYDLPGESHAIETAERLGVPARVLDRAKSYMDRSSGGSSALLQNLRQKMTDMEDLQTELSEKQTALNAELEKLQAERDAIVEEFRKEAREAITKAQKQISDLQQSIKSGKMKAGTKSAEALEEIKKEIVASLGAPLERQIPTLEVGSFVRAHKFNQEGTVSRILDGGKLEVAIRGITVIADMEDVTLITRRPEKKNPSKIQPIGVDISPAAPRWEVNVIGRRVDEALPLIEKAIDRAILGGLPSLSIIHGKGTGRLKKAVWEYLSDNPLVKSFQSGDARAGGEGITVVEIASE
jgi:DNA mismatch repair protein MutS2